jgi:hypothetical protein
MNMEPMIWEVIQNTITMITASSGACGSVVAKELYYKPKGRGFETWWGEFFSVYLILPATLGPGLHSGYNRNEYQKQKNNDVPWE